MKAKVTRTETKFQPIELTITIENENDLKWYAELFSIPKVMLLNIDDIFRGLQNPDTNGELNDMLYNELMKIYK